MHVRSMACFWVGHRGELWPAVIFALLTAATGCATTHPSGGSTSGPSYATYVIEGRSVRLVAGHAEVEAVSGSATLIRTDVVGRMTHGDLDGDRDEDAAVILAQDSGGSGVFYYVAAALRDGSTFTGTPGLLLGDRIVVEGLAIRDGVIVVDHLERRPGDPMTAAPTERRSVRLALKEGKLAPEESIAGGGMGVGASDPLLLSISNVEWRLLRFTWDGANYLLSIETIPTFTIDTWGTVAGFGSINRYFGEMTVGDGGRFTWRGAIGGTRMAGPKPLMDQEQTFLLALQYANRMFLRDGHLVIEDATGRNVLEFER
jgi:heat shock protein HslJ